MSGIFRTTQNVTDKLVKLDPVGSKVMPKVDPAGNMIGAYGSNAPEPLFGDKVGDALGIYGTDSREYDQQTAENERVKALQQGETDMAAVNARTSAMLTSDKYGRRTTAMQLLGK